MNSNYEERLAEFKDYTEREYNEIRFAMLYAEQFAHGTAGHTQYMLIAKLAKDLIYRDVPQRPED